MSGDVSHENGEGDSAKTKAILSEKVLPSKEDKALKKRGPCEGEAVLEEQEEELVHISSIHCPLPRNKSPQQWVRAC